MEASETKNPELLPFIRASYGLAGIVYEVTFKIKPLEIISFDYDVHDVEDLKDSTIKKAIVVEPEHRDVDDRRRHRDSVAQQGEEAEARVAGRREGVRLELPGRLHRPRHSRSLWRNRARQGSRRRLGGGLELAFYRLLSAGGGFTLEAPDKTINYSKTPQSARYAFTFWAFPRADYVKNIKDYVKWADDYYKQTGFRCNMPLGSYFIRKDRSSLLSYTWDGDIISLDPIHAPSEKEPEAWPTFLKAFNEWAHQRGGIPLLNQSPFVKKEHVVDAYGDRWKKLGDWLKTVDPDRRMVNEFFAELL